MNDANTTTTNDIAAEQSKPGELPDSGKPPRRGVRSFLLLLVVVAGGAAGLVWWRSQQGWESTDDAFIEGSLVPVSSRVPGEVDEVLVKDNEVVPEGSLLVRLNPDIATAELDAAKARLEVAKSRVEVARAGIAGAEADREAAKAEAAMRGSDLARYNRLDPKLVSEQKLDAARTASTAAGAAVRAAENKVMALKAELGQAEAQLKEAEARARRAELDVSYTQITAPVAGRVTRKSVEVGQHVGQSQQLLVLVPNDLWVIANFKETQIAHIRQGQPVSIRVDAYPDAKFTGHVDSVQQGAGSRFSLLPPENATGNYVKVVQRLPVKILLDRSSEPDVLLGPGMSVVPSVDVRSEHSTSDSHGDNRSRASRE